MVTKDLRQGLTNDPDVQVSYIVTNNPVAVSERLQALGFSVGSRDDMFEALNQLIQDKRWPEFVQALSVPMRTEGVDAVEAAIVLEVASGVARAKSPGGIMKMGVIPTMDDNDFPPDDGGTGATSGGSPSGSSATGGANFANAFGLIGGTVADILSVLMSSGGDATLTNTDTSDAAAGAAAAEKERKAKAMRTTIIVAVTAVVLIVAGFLVYRAMRKKKA